MFVFNFNTNQAPWNGGSSRDEQPPPQPLQQRPQHQAPPAEDQPTMEEYYDVVERANQRIDVLERERSYWRRQTQKRERQLQELAADPEPEMVAPDPPQQFPPRKGKGKGRGKHKGRGKGSGQHGHQNGPRRAPAFTGPIRPLPEKQQRDPTDMALDEVVEMKEQKRKQNRHTKPKYRCRAGPVPVLVGLNNPTP